MSPQDMGNTLPSYGDSNSDWDMPVGSKKAENLPSRLELEKGGEEEIQGGIFGGEGGDSFRNVGRWGCLFALITNQLGLGVLSLPSCLKTLGLVPGLIAIYGIGCLAWYTGYLVFRFYLRYPSMVNIVDSARIMGGKWWELFAAIFFIIQQTMTCSSAVVTLSIAFNTLSNHAMCTVGFIGIASIGCMILCTPRTVKFVSQSGVPTFISIISASLVVIIALGVSGPPQAPPGWKSDFQVIGHPSFRDAVNALFRLLYSFAGHHAFISYMAEMRDPKKDFPFSMGGLFITSMVLYSGLAVAIYVLAGSWTTSPALGSAPVVSAKVAYGLVLIAVFTTALGPGHVGIKYLFVRTMEQMKATGEITANTVRSWSVWMGCVIAFWIVCFIIANAVPVFDSILSISSSTTYAWFGYGLAAVFWFHLNQGDYFTNWKQKSFFALNTGIICLAFFMNGAGLWASITELIDIFAKEEGVRGSFDCGNNALF